MCQGIFTLWTDLMKRNKEKFMKKPYLMTIVYLQFVEICHISCEKFIQRVPDGNLMGWSCSKPILIIVIL